MAVEGEEGVEVVGRTVDEAVQKGLETLKLRRDQVNIEIVSDGARTLLGFRPGQVRVRVAPKPAPPKVRAPEARPSVREQPAEQEAVAARAVEPAVAPSEIPSEAVAAEAGEPGAEGGAPALASDLEVARRVLSEMLDRMGVRANVEIHPPDGDEAARLNITGKNLGMLIGRRGETLTAMQFLTRLMVSHQVQRWVNVTVDVDNYRLKREETLRRLAMRMAEQAIETGRVQELEPMPPSERRIVHIALRDFGGVSSQSIGEGESRRVTIVPAKSRA